MSTVGAAGWHEKGNNNGVIGEGRPSKQPVFLWELPVLTAFTLSLTCGLVNTQKTSADIFSIAFEKCALKDTIEGIFILVKFGIFFFLTCTQYKSMQYEEKV